MHQYLISNTTYKAENTTKKSQDYSQLDFDSIYNLYQKEFSFHCEKLLIKSRSDILDNFFEKMKSIIYYYYNSEDKLNLENIIKKCENDFVTYEYIPMYNALSLTLSIISTNINTKNKIRYSILNENLNYINNFMPHCFHHKTNNEYAIHSCGEKLIQINSKIIKSKNENNKNKYNNKGKNRTYGELNVHNENFLSLLNKDININGDEEENGNESELKIKKGNGDLYNNVKIQEILEENMDLKEKESLLSTQLIAIKQELKETRLFLDETKNKNNELVQEIKTQGTLKNENLIGSLRNCLEKLITEIKINSKIKEILIVLLRLACYTEEQIETIFKYKDKKKNIINVFQM